jgi:hypothetical protein
MAWFGAPSSEISTPPSRWRAAGRVAFAALLVFATCGPSVFAEDDSPAAFFRADKELMQRQTQPKRVVQRPTHLIRRAAPVRGFTREEPAHAGTPGPDGTVPAPDGTTQQADGVPTPAPPPDQPTLPAGPVPPPVQNAEKPALPKPSEPSFTMAVIGDSLGQMLGQGLTEAYADQPEISVLRRARENTGLVRDDYFDWPKAARDLLAGKDKLDAVVMMIGSNDRQQLRDGTQSIDIRSDRWKQIYADRVSAIAQMFKDRKVPLIWVGMPVMKNERLSSDMVQLNEIYRERVSRAGGIYVDTWEAFLDDRGQFASYGPDLNGQFQKLRAGDGVHFTKSGARKLAHFVEVEIKRLMDDAKPAIDPAVAVVTTPPVPEPAPPSGETARATPAPGPAGNPLAALPIPAAPAEVVIRVKPAAGAVMPLTGPAIAPGGQLASGRARPANTSGTEAQALIDRALVQGRPLDARPGRGDDFAWPPRP